MIRSENGHIACKPPASLALTLKKAKGFGTASQKTQLLELEVVFAGTLISGQREVALNPGDKVWVNHENTAQEWMKRTFPLRALVGDKKEDEGEEGFILVPSSAILLVQSRDLMAEMTQMNQTVIPEGPPSMPFPISVPTVTSVPTVISVPTVTFVVNGTPHEYQYIHGTKFLDILAGFLLSTRDLPAGAWTWQVRDGQGQIADFQVGVKDGDRFYLNPPIGSGG